MANCAASFRARSPSGSAMPTISTNGRLRSARAWCAATYPAPTSPTFTLLLGSIFFQIDLFDDPLHGFAERPHSRVGRLRRSALAVSAVDPHRAAAGRLSGFDVAPAVADQKAAGQVRAETRSSFQYQPRLGLAAIASVAVVVRAYQNLVQRQLASQPRANRIHGFGGLCSARHIRLVRHDNQREAPPFQPLQRLRGARHNPHFGCGLRWIRFAVPYDGFVQHAVAVQKDGSLQRTDSHLVSACFTSGCETRGARPPPE